jgi:ABC-type dipeptide/oligopeptide/nickel transport system ATPase component
MYKPEKDSVPIAYVTKDGGSKQFIWIDKDNKQGSKTFITDGHITPLPYIEMNQRSASFISGASGSGKTTYSKNMISEIRAKPKYKKYKVYLFTGSSEVDPAFEKIEDMYIVNINDPSFFDLDYNEFKECIVLMDDYEAIINKDIRLHLEKLLKGLLECSRKKSVIILIINHMTQNYNKTRGIIFESDTFVLFPSFNINSTIRFLKSYMDFTKSELEDIKRLANETRSITIRKVVPRYLISDHQIRLL